MIRENNRPVRDLVKHLVDNHASMGNNMGVDGQKSVDLKALK